MSYFSSHPLRLVEFNVENLFVLLEKLPGSEAVDFSAISEKDWQKLTSSVRKNKPIEHVRAIARAVLDIDPDILMLCEVGGRESLENFNRYFLDGKYAAHLIEGNSDRGIDLGYLVKRDLPFTYDLISHRHREIDFLYEHERLSQETGYGHLRSARKASHRFSRDVLEFRIYEDANQPPVLIALMVHLKSQLDRDRIDPGGRDRRKAELDKLVTIYEEISGEHQGQVPIVLAGDFNGVAALPEPSPEFESIYTKTNLKDCLEIAGVPTDERFTFQQFNRGRPGLFRQLDYVFVPPSLVPRVSKEESWVYRYKDPKGQTQLLPRNLNEKRLLPSDHYPVILTLMGR